MTTVTDQPQHLKALEMANRTRLANAAVRRGIAAQPTVVASRLEAARVLRELPAEAGPIRAFDLLLACKRVGRGKALLMLRSAQVSESRRLRDMTDRERGALAGRLVGR